MTAHGAPIGDRGRSTARKILFTVTVLTIAAGFATAGTYATFTASDNATDTIRTGTVDINLGAVGANNRLNDYTTNFVPGDTMQKRVKITNAGTETAAAVTLSTTATFSSLLDTDATNGLHIQIERCAGTIGWTETSAVSPTNGIQYTYTCDATAVGDDAGTRATVLAHRPVIGTNLALTAMNALAIGGTDDLVVTIDLPAGSGNTFENTSSTINYTFTATQRAATDK